MLAAAVAAPPPSPAEPLEALAVELSDLAMRAAALQAALAPQALAPHAPSGLAPGVLRGLQDLDYLTQALSALSSYVGAMAAGADAPSALAVHGLSGLSARLAGAPAPRVDDDFELF